MEPYSPRADSLSAGRLLESMPIGFIFWDRQWRFAGVNPEGERLCGLSAGQMSGRVLWELFPEVVGTEFETVYRRVAATGGAGSVEIFYPEPLNRWLDIHVAADPAGVAAYFLDASVRHAAQDEASRALGVERAATDALIETAAQRDASASRLAALAAVALALTTAATVEDLERIVITQGLQVLGVDGGAVVSRAASGGWRITVSDALGPDVQVRYAEAEHHSPLPACWAARTGRELLLPTRAAGLAFHPIMASIYADTGRDAWALLPLGIEGRTIGCLAVSWVDERSLAVDELELLAGFAAQCAQALQRIEATHAERATARRIGELAAALQHALLTAPPISESIHIAVRYQPATETAEVGGDWYDAFIQPDGATMLVIGDVAGHDSVAAGKMGQLRGLVRALAYTADGTPQPTLGAAARAASPASILQRVEQVARGLAVDVLAVVARIAPARNVATGGATMTWSNAGHLPPIILRPDGSTELLATDRHDLLLGVDPHFPRRDHTADLPPGATVLLYTDGLVERRDADLDDGTARLRAILAGLAHLTPDEICDAVLDQMTGRDGEDDVALLAARIAPSARV